MNQFRIMVKLDMDSRAGFSKKGNSDVRNIGYLSVSFFEDF